MKIYLYFRIDLLLFDDFFENVSCFEIIDQISDKTIDMLLWLLQEWHSCELYLMN